MQQNIFRSPPVATVAAALVQGVSAALGYTTGNPGASVRRTTGAATGATLNAQLIPTPLSPALAEREKDYTFTQVSADAIFTDFTRDAHDYLLQRLSDKQLWICQTLDVHPAEPDFPVSQTYIDTCLAGCLEHGGQEEAKRFIAQTSLWEHPRVNDRVAPQYPRAALVDSKQIEHIDTLLSNR